MTQFSDDIYIGAAKSLPTVANPFNGGLGVGPIGRVYFYDIVPLTKQSNNLATAQAVGAAGNLTLTAGTGVTSITDPGGHAAIAFDVPRTVSITSSGADSGKTMTVSGYDTLGQPQTETITGPATTTVNGKKAFKSIWQIAVSAATAGNISAGSSDIFGIPVAVADLGYVQDVGWAGALTRDAGTAVAADTTSPATATTGDVRGTYAPSSASDGTKRLVFALALTGIQAGPNATFAGVFGVTPA
jgi:hypothetical protein